MIQTQWYESASACPLIKQMVRFTWFSSAYAVLRHSSAVISTATSYQQVLTFELH